GQAMAQELRKLGVNIEIGDDYIIIPKCEIKAPAENIYCHNDHRIAMSLAILCSVTGGILEGAKCINKSYPDFFEDIKKLGVEYKII
ncbi:MAG: 3-phosphoshikimate 1-carboxyvinyltransferase, partial [Clostridia bacterium]|nr:3-phosphoshikimate 1-carboxyvinyltransferase [Clostridia bacterium]